MTNTNREFLIAYEFTEPRHPQQNPTEGMDIRWIKSHAQILMDRVGAPAVTWYDACKYLADIHNRTANKALEWETPLAKRHGDTPDISAYILFSFYEQIYYLDHMTTFPDSKEKTGRFLGVSDNTGDALTFIIWDEQSETRLIRSVIRSAEPSNK